MTGSLLGGNSDCLCKQPSGRATTKQEGVGRVAPAYSSSSKKKKLDPNWRVCEVAWPEAIHMAGLD